MTAEVVKAIVVFLVCIGTGLVTLQLIRMIGGKHNE